jgi:hypothetical protein
MCGNGVCGALDTGTWTVALEEWDPELLVENYPAQQIKKSTKSLNEILWPTPVPTAGGELYESGVLYFYVEPNGVVQAYLNTDSGHVDADVEVNCTKTPQVLVVHFVNEAPWDLKLTFTRDA